MQVFWETPCLSFEDLQFQFFASPPAAITYVHIQRTSNLRWRESNVPIKAGTWWTGGDNDSRLMVVLSAD